MYVGKHERRPEPSALPYFLRGVADLVTVIDDEQERSE
jgi:hypothetical protein